MLKGSYSRLVMLSLGPIDTLDEIILAVKGSPVHCRILGIIPGFYPRDTSNTRCPPVLTTKHVTRHCCQMSPGEQNRPQLKISTLGNAQFGGKYPISVR